MAIPVTMEHERYIRNYAREWVEHLMTTQGVAEVGDDDRGWQNAAYALESEYGSVTGLQWLWPVFLETFEMGLRDAEVERRRMMDSESLASSLMDRGGK